TAVSSVRVEALSVEPVDIPGDFDRLPACYEQDPQCWEMTLASRFGETTDKLEAFAQANDAERGDSTLATAQRFSRLVHDKLRYEPDRTTADSPIDDALELGCGVCQDFTHVLIALCRRVGLPARYVSGYLFRGTPSDAGAPAHAVRPVEAAPQWQGQTQAQSMQQAEQADTDSTDATHAWTEVYVPDHGWIGLDPTHDEPVGERHIRTAVGRDYADVPPTRGVYRGNSQGKMEVGVRVTELDTPDQLKPIAPPALQYTGWTPPEVMPDVPDEPKPFEYYAQQMQQQQQR
ncbi:MAG: transglutaminase family protein, partial [Planctomycetota bacterium]